DVHLLAAGGARGGLAWSFLPDDRQRPVPVDLDATRISLRAGLREATVSRASGVPTRVLLRNDAGRVDASIEMRDVRVLQTVPDALLTPPPFDAKKAVLVEPASRTKERFAREALGALIELIRGAARRDPALLEGDAPRVTGLFTRAYTALFRAFFPEDRLRAEARLAARKDAATVRDALARAGAGGRVQALADLRGRFRENCKVLLSDAAHELADLGEQLIGAGDPPGDEASERLKQGLVRASGDAVVQAFLAAVVDPMDDEAAREIERIAAEPAATATGTAIAPAAGGTP
ncbi:MAG: hypothetical protein ACRELB_22200, partial [Polyangiaceae bacterium]